jgi:hypothetical protein
MDVLKKKRTRNNRELINEIKTLKKKLREKSKLFNEQINDLKKDSNEKSKQINDLKKDSNEKSKQIKICNEQINDLKKGEKKQKFINQQLIQKINELEKLTDNNAFSKLYKEEIIKLYENSQNKSKSKIQNNNQNNFETKNKNNSKFANEIITELNKIDNSKKKKQKSLYKSLYKDVKKIKFKFGAKINNKKLKKFIINAVKHVNSYCKPNQKKVIKQFFCKMVKDNIIKNLSTKKIGNDVIKDLLLAYFKNKNFGKIEKIDSLFLFDKVSNIPLNEIVVENYKLNKDFLKNAVKKKIIINNYIKVCQNYVQNYNINKCDAEELSKILSDHIDKMNIYFGELLSDICGISIHSGDIIINTKYLNGIYSECSPIKLECLAAIFLTILHELSHILVRIINDLLLNKNYSKSVDLNTEKNNEEKKIELQEPDKLYKSKDEEEKIRITIENIMEKLNRNFKTTKTNKENKENQFNESGEYFDNNLFYNKNYNIITLSEAQFFLNLENYDYDEPKYKSKLENVYKIRSNKSEKGFCLKLGENSSEKGFIIGKCARFFFRNNN